jgi:hypothetical protein
MMAQKFLIERAIEALKVYKTLKEGLRQRLKNEQSQRCSGGSGGDSGGYAPPAYNPVPPPPVYNPPPPPVYNPPPPPYNSGNPEAGSRPPLPQLPSDFPQFNV